MKGNTIKSKLLAGLLMVSMLMVGGCANTPGQSAKRVLTLGTNAEFPPFEFVAEGEKGIVGKYDGVDIAISKKISEELGYELEVSHMEFDSLIMALQSDRIDFIAAAMTIKPERLENVDFTDTYFKAVQYIIVRSDNTDIRTVDDLNGKIVGVQQGTTGDFIVSDEEGVKEIRRYSRGVDAVMDLRQNKIDAIVIDSMPATVFVNRTPSDFILVKNQWMLVKTGSDKVTNGADLDGKQIGVLKGSTAEYIVQNNVTGAQAIVFDDLEKAKEDLLADKIDVVLTDDSVAEKMLDDSANALSLPSGDNDVFGSSKFEAEEYAIAVKKGNSALLEEINGVLRAMKESGEIDELVTSYSE